MSKSQDSPYYLSHFDLDPMTWILKLDLDMDKMFQNTKNEISVKVFKNPDRHTDI